ncbi:nucleotide exchange factor GrpE [Lentilactobacillus kosonis]|uniref:Protein GrpE n=1 Tax=Lentilactobacillus kosonis TaxID=2810561 RepID=A0A401FL86_9LACO|nr:nucleotide exchange factor GrpE [Lentilactobacillus kosonis]GAY73107.1 heat shock protein GrpE [Lentilactobacillus kosonis]
MSEEKHDSAEEPVENSDAVNDDSHESTDDQASEQESSPEIDQVDQLKAQLDDMENKYLRAEAEIKNIQNRAKKEQADLIKYDGQQLAHDILPIVDNLQRALSVEVTDESGKQLKQGVQMVSDHLEKALLDNKVEKIDAQGAVFDPKYHQAIQTVDANDDHKADTVVQVLQEGYRLNDRVLRPAMVVVAKII